MAEVLRPAIVPAPALRALEFLFVGRPEIHHTVAAGAVHAGRSLPPLAPVVRARRVPGVDREVDIRQPVAIERPAPGTHLHFFLTQAPIGSAPCRERVCRYVSILGVAVS